jgi:hypothetical protein
VKVVGADGVIAQNTVTGAVRAILNSTSPVSARPPYSVTAAPHNARVLEYFTSCGLPVDQVGMVQALTLMNSDSSTPSNTDVEPRFVAYTTLITRQVNGIPIPDSFARRSL